MSTIKYIDSSENEISQVDNDKTSEMRIWAIFGGLLIVVGTFIMLIAYWSISYKSEDNTKASTYPPVLTPEGIINTELVQEGDNSLKTSINASSPTSMINSNATVMLTPMAISNSASNTIINNKTLATGEIWDIGIGLTLTATSIDAKSSPRQTRFILSRNGTKLDDKVLYEAMIYKYNDVFSVKIDSIFTGNISNMVRLTELSVFKKNISKIPKGKIVYSKVIGYSFIKPNIEINAGDEVLWDNHDDDTLTIVELDNKMDNITLKGFGRAKYQFLLTGNYKFGLFYRSKQISPSIQNINVVINVSQ